MDFSLPHTFGRYTLQRRLSHTSQGAVYLATDTRLDRPVTLTMPNFATADRATLERFYREARLVAQVAHPNLCPVYDVACENGVHYLTMAYLDGVPLAQRLGEQHRWPAAQACLLVRKLALALQQLHNLNLMHRAVKPENVLLQPDGNPVLIDPGLGAPPSSQEQTIAYRPGTSGDLHALGQLLFHLLTGAPPDDDADPKDGTLVTTPRLAPRLAGIDPALLSLCADVLANDPAAQLDSMQAFADRLRRFCPASEASSGDVGHSFPTLEQAQPEHHTQTPTVATAHPKRRSRRWVAPVALVGLLVIGATAVWALWPQDTAQVEIRRQSNERILLRSGTLESVRLEVERHDFDAPLEIQVVEPIAGLEVGPVTLPTGANAFILQLRASADAPLQKTVLQLRAMSGNKARGTIDIPLQIEPPAFRNSVGMAFVLIPPGRFRMGSTDADDDARPDESPLHDVAISQPFYLGVYEVTQQEYQRVVGTNPSYFAAGKPGAAKVTGQDTNRWPVDSLSWDEANTFCTRLSQLDAEQTAERLYRLPTEAEWEYACRGGRGNTKYHFGDTLPAAEARFDAATPVPVGQIGSANGFGLYDLHGNVAEWCQDWYGRTYYQDSPEIDPSGPTRGTEGTRVIRGGSFGSTPERCRAANRDHGLPENGSEFVGLRVVCTLRR